MASQLPSPISPTPNLKNSLQRSQQQNPNLEALISHLNPRNSIKTILELTNTIDSHTLLPPAQHEAAQSLINASRVLIEEAKTIMGEAWVKMDPQTKEAFELGTEFDPRYPRLEPLPRRKEGVLECESDFPLLGKAGFENAWGTRSEFFRGFEFGIEGERGKEGGGGRWKGDGGEAWLRDRKGDAARVGEKREKSMKREVVIEQKDGRTEVVVREWRDGELVKDRKHISDGKRWDHGEMGKEMEEEVDEVFYHKGDKNEGLRGSW